MARRTAGTRTKISVALALLASSLAVGLGAQKVGASNVPLPTAEYRISVNAASSDQTATVYSGRGSWTSVELVNGELAVPLFKVAGDQKVPARSSVIVSDLGGATAVRGALDSVTQVDGDGCFGKSADEQAALSLFVLPDGDDPNDPLDWDPAGVLVEHEREDDSCFVLSVGTAGFSHVMFVVDLYCRSTDAAVAAEGQPAPECDSVDGNVPGGTNLSIEIEGSGDGEFNSGRTGETININSQTKDGDVLTLETADGDDEGDGPDPHGLQVGDVVTGVPGCFSGSFEVESVLDSSRFTIVAACANAEGGADLSVVAKGDEAYEVVFGGRQIVTYPDDGPPLNGLTNDVDEFLGVDFADFSGLLQVPECADAEDDLCVENPTDGWGVTLLDEFGTLTLRPWRTTYPYHVPENTAVEFELRLPTGEWRDHTTGEDIAEGFSIARSFGYIDSYEYSEGADYATLSFALQARSTTRVTRFGDDGFGGNLFFDDGCTDGLTVIDGEVFVDQDFDGEKDEAESTFDCENEDEGFEVTSVSLWGDPGVGNDDDRAWLYADGNDYAVGDSVAVCCAYGAFDGYQEIVAVGDPYEGTIETEEGSTSELGWFAFSTSASADFNDKSFPLDDDGDPGFEVVSARSVDRLYVRVAATTMTLDVTLVQPLPFDPEADDNNDFLAGGFISTNGQGVAFGDAMFAPENPAFDFGLAGPSTRANGVARSTDGFFRACVPAEFVRRVWEISGSDAVIASAAATRVNGRSASADPGRSGGVSAAATTCGASSGVSVSLSGFGYSAPYFALRPGPVSESGGGDPPTTTAAPTTSAPATTVAPPTTGPTASTLPPRQIPGPGRVIPIETPPPARVADGIGLKASASAITLAIDPPATAVRRGQTIEVRVIGADGTRRTIRLRPSSDGRNVVASFNGLGAGEYRIVVVVKNRNGRPAGRWRSPTVEVRGRGR